jgi:hypothetical protein
VRDLIEHIETELHHTRQTAAQAIDRCDALTRLRGEIVRLCHELDRPTPPATDLLHLTNDEHSRAVLVGLINRAFPDPNGDTT